MKTLATILVLALAAAPFVSAQSGGASTVSADSASDATEAPDAPAMTAAEHLEAVYNYLLISEDLATGGQIAYDQIAALKEEGYEVVVNLAAASQAGNALEGYLVAEQGLTYMHIPVSWREPAMRDLELFFDVMQANVGRKVFVHCAANMRASAFTYLYRTLVLGDEEAAARADMNMIWDPADVPQWGGFVERAPTEVKR